MADRGNGADYNNKYTFVWKKAVTKNQEKLLIKLAGFIAECEQLYGLKIVYGDSVKMKHVKKLRKKLFQNLLEILKIRADVSAVTDKRMTVWPERPRSEIILRKRLKYLSIMETPKM